MQREELKPGATVKIVDRWDGFVGQNLSGDMDCWLGKIMTILSGDIINNRFSMIEDGGRWVWNSRMFDLDFDECSADNDPITVAQDDLTSVIGILT